MTSAQAAAFTAADSLVFGSGETIKDVFFTSDEVAGSVTIGSVIGKFLTFNSNIFGKAAIVPDGSQMFIGGPAGDVWSATDGSDALYGGGGSDSLAGRGGADSLLGEAGDDSLNGGLGQDVLTGGGGADTFVVTAFEARADLGGDRITDWTSSDRLAFHAGATASDFATLTAANSGVGRTQADALIAGGAKNYVAVETPEGVWVFADSAENNGAADDVVLLAGRTLADISFSNVVGGAPDTPGGAGTETISGSYAADTISGGAGGDFIAGYNGADSLSGDAGVDTLSGGLENDIISGGAGADRLQGDSGNDRFVFGVGDSGTTAGALDQIVDWEVEDRIVLPAAVDASRYLEFTAASYAEALSTATTQISQGAASVVSVAVSGSVVVFVDSANDGGAPEDAIALVGAALDKVSAVSFGPLTPENYQLGTAGADTLTSVGQGYLDGAGGDDSLTGSQYNDTLRGGEGADTIAAGGPWDQGADSIDGGAGDDKISIGGGVDTINGADGNDTVFAWRQFPADGMAVRFDGGAGIDRIDYSGSYVAQTGEPSGVVVDLRGGAAGRDTLSGVEIVAGTRDADTLTGSSGVDTLEGGEGFDILRGAGGADRLIGGSGHDIFYVTAGESGVAEGQLDVIADWSSDDELNLSGAPAKTETYAELTAASYGAAQTAANALIAAGTVNYVAVQVDADVVVFADTANNNGAADDAVILAGSTLADISMANIGGNGPPLGLPRLPGASSPGPTGTAGNDQLSNSNVTSGVLFAGLGGNDTIFASTPQDTIEGGAGDDYLRGPFGGWGIVSYANATSGVWVDLARGTAQDVGGGQGIDTLFGFGTVIGSPYGDTLSGNSQSGVLRGGGGADSLVGGQATQMILGGDGADTIVGNSSASIEGGAGADSITGDSAHNVLGQAGDDWIVSSGQATGGDGDDTLQSGTSFAVTLSGGGGNDSLAGGSGNDVLDAGSGWNTVSGGGGADFIDLSALRPTTESGAAGATIDGGGGFDTLSFGGVQVTPGLAVSANVANGVGVIAAYGATSTAASVSFTSIEAVLGSFGADSLVGSASGERLLGGDGSDTLVGAGGDDTLDGGENDDVLSGGAGRDTLSGGGGADFFIFGAGDSSTVSGGLDVITDFRSDDYLVVATSATAADYFAGSAATYADALALANSKVAAGINYVAIAVGANVFVFADTTNNDGAADDAVQLSGRSLADIDPGSFIAAVIPPAVEPPPSGGGGGGSGSSGGGGGGGGGGSSGGEFGVGGFRSAFEDGTPVGDLRAFGPGDASFNGGMGDDTLDGEAGEDLLYGGPGNDIIHGGLDNDSIEGGEGANYLRGDEGADRIVGGSGFDDINGNQGDDTAAGALGDDWVVGGKDQDLLFGNDGADIVYGNLGNDTLGGGSGDDLVRGGQGSDILRGDEGKDWLSGDRGDDTLTGGQGADIFHTFSEAGLDRVTDFSVSDGDRVQLDPGTVYSVTQDGFDTVIDMGGGNRMVLLGVSLSSLPAGWIFGA